MRFPVLDSGFRFPVSGNEAFLAKGWFFIVELPVGLSLVSGFAVMLAPAIYFAVSTINLLKAGWDGAEDYLNHLTLLVSTSFDDDFRNRHGKTIPRSHNLPFHNKFIVRTSI
jgi:hypothetical protein